MGQSASAGATGATSTNSSPVKSTQFVKQHAALRKRVPVKQGLSRGVCVCVCVCVCVLHCVCPHAALYASLCVSACCNAACPQRPHAARYVSACCHACPHAQDASARQARAQPCSHLVYFRVCVCVRECVCLRGFSQSRLLLN